MITIVDYGMGNLRSVQKAVQNSGYEVQVSSDPHKIKCSDALIVPGVGAFDRAVKNLKERALWSVLEEHLADQRPYLGICLGLQLLFESSEEGVETGFSIFEGKVVKFQRARLVPHMGWNSVNWQGPGKSLAPGRVSEPCYYFVHSYYPRPEDESIVAGRADYAGSFCAAIRSGNCFGVQFHPEKSQYAGLDLLDKILQKLV